MDSATSSPPTPSPFRVRRLTARHWVAAAGVWSILAVISSAKTLLSLQAQGIDTTFGAIALPTVGAALVWALLTPPLMLWALAQPPLLRAPWRLLFRTTVLVVGLPWVHALIRRLLDAFTEPDANGISGYYLRFFTPDAFVLITLVAAAQTVIYLEQGRRTRERQALLAAEAARSDVEAQRLMAQPTRLREALAALHSSLTHAPNRTEPATVLLGDLVRIWQRTTGLALVRLKDEVTALLADRAFVAALAGVAPDVRAEVGSDVERAYVPNGILTCLLSSGVMEPAAGASGGSLRLEASREGSTLRLVLEGPREGSGTRVQGPPSPELRRRLDQIYPCWRLSTPGPTEVTARLLLELPFDTSAGPEERPSDSP